MKVILLEDVKGVGKKNQVVEVSAGYGSNYLIPKHLAVLSTKTGLEVRDRQILEEQKALELKKLRAQEEADKLKDIVLEFNASASKDGRMMGTISPKQIEQELKNKYGIVIDKRKFVDKIAVNAFGYTNLKVELFKDVIATIRVHVTEKK